MLDTDGDFENRLEYFRAMSGPAPDQPLLSPINDAPILAGTLRQAKQLNLFVIAWLLDDQYSVGGFVDDVAKDAVTIAEHTKFGEATGMVTFALESVSYLICGSDECLHAQHLVAHRQEFLEFCRRRCGR